MLQLPRRLASIDVFRALTMFLMIFVNDLWTLAGVPGWMEHTKAAEDGLGLADTVFPAFLFLVGLSIPFAIQNRLSKGESRAQITFHIIIRSLILLVMGILHVNLEHYSEATIISKPIWEILITVGFFLVWMEYPAQTKKQLKNILQYLGVIILVTMILIYRGGPANDPIGMRPYWWGILGLIGWAYLISALIYLYSGGKLWIQIASLAFFHLFCAANMAGWLDPLSGIRNYVWIIENGSMPAFTMGGVVAAVLYRNLAGKGKESQFWLALGVMAILLFAFGFGMRPFWGISKIRATPAWNGICSGISVVMFGLLIYIVDIKGKLNWFKIIRPAGTSTLTAYLLPYIHYSLYAMVGVSLPLILRTGIMGIFKSLIYALVIILITGLLEKKGIRMKI